MKNKNKVQPLDNSPETINRMKGKMLVAAIHAFNSKYFAIEELTRVQDEIELANTQEEIRDLVAEHHLRVMDQFRTDMMAGLAE